MLELTQGAAEAIRNVLASIDDEELPAESGLRITTESTDPEGTDFALTIVGGPEDGDATVSGHGANVYLSSGVSELLSDKVLDAHSHDDHVHFTIGTQGEEPEPHEH